ncbi:MAG: DMT family transporter [bacterium]|nr:DMT family transporter [bacterium]
MSSRPSGRLIVTVLLFQQILGAMAFPISKFGLAVIEPFTFAFYRFLISSILLLAIVRMRKQGIPVEKKDWWKIIGLGVLIIPLNQTLYLWGQSMTAAGHGSFLFATVPIWILLMALTHLKEKLVWRRIVGVLVAFSGVGVIMFSGAASFGRDYLWGDFIILVAVIAWAYYTVFGKPLVQKYGAFRVTAYSLASGSVIYFPFGLYMAMKFDYSQATVGAWGAVLYMAIGTSVAAYVLWYWVLKFMEVSRIAVFQNMQPIMASLVAMVWLGEPLGWTFVIGGSVALLGVIVAEI